jgi:hypothetical protein
MVSWEAVSVTAMSGPPSDGAAGNRTRFEVLVPEPTGTELRNDTLVIHQN